jgi:hypothetical protein
MKLYRETVTFNRVFDVVRTRGYETPAHTLFGFETSTTKHHGVRVSGHPRVEVGDTVTAVLGKPGNWQTLQGWLNHAIREVAAPSVAGSSITSAAMLSAAAACILLTGLTVSSLLSAPFLFGAIYWLRYALAASAIRKELQRDGA